LDDETIDKKYLLGDFWVAHPPETVKSPYSCQNIVISKGYGLSITFSLPLETAADISLLLVAVMSAPCNGPAGTTGGSGWRLRTSNWSPLQK